MNDKVYLIKNVEEYGKLMAYCIEHDISVWRTYWNEKEAGSICYNPDFRDKRCYYAPAQFYKNGGYEAVTPKFGVDQWGNITLEEDE